MDEEEEEAEEPVRTQQRKPIRDGEEGDGEDTHSSVDVCMMCVCDDDDVHWPVTCFMRMWCVICLSCDQCQERAEDMSLLECALSFIEHVFRSTDETIFYTNGQHGDKL